MLKLKHSQGGEREREREKVVDNYHRINLRGTEKKNWIETCNISYILTELTKYGFYQTSLCDFSLTIL